MGERRDGNTSMTNTLGLGGLYAETAVDREAARFVNACGVVVIN